MADRDTSRGGLLATKSVDSDTLRQGAAPRRWESCTVRPLAQRAGHAGVPYLPESASTQRQDQVWVGDVTYLKVAGQWHYMAAVMDKHTRRIVGWSLGARRDAALTREALVQSAWSRCVSPGVVFHSDRGIEFANFEFRKQLSDLVAAILAAGVLRETNAGGVLCEDR